VDPDEKGWKAVSTKPSFKSIIPLMNMMAAVNNPVGKRIVRITGERYRPIPKGCKVWEFEGIKIIALNEKNAMRKAAKIREWLTKHRPALKEKPKSKTSLKAAQPKSNLKGSATLKR
jgi:hypothetical protein